MVRGLGGGVLLQGADDSLVRLGLDAAATGLVRRVEVLGVRGGL